jgi:hypothetical protein
MGRRFGNIGLVPYLAVVFVAEIALGGSHRLPIRNAAAFRGVSVIVSEDMCIHDRRHLPAVESCVWTEGRRVSPFHILIAARFVD